jgi:hypothetical protein
MPHNQLLAACLRTSYQIELPDGATLTIRIGAHSPALDTLLMQYQARTFAYLTADNPRSTALDVQTNRERYARLLADIRQLGLPYLPGIATSDEFLWEPERCLFVPELSIADLRALGAKYQQDVAVVGQRGAAPHLFFHIEETNYA